MSRPRREARSAAASRTASRIWAGETALDTALHELGMLCADLPKLRVDAQLSAVAGQQVFAEASRAYGFMVQARGALVNAHLAAESLRTDMGLAPLAVPGVDKPPPRAFAANPVVLPLAREAA